MVLKPVGRRSPNVGAAAEGADAESDGGDGDAALDSYVSNDDNAEVDGGDRMLGSNADFIQLMHSTNMYRMVVN